MFVIAEGKSDPHPAQLLRDHEIPISVMEIKTRGGREKDNKECTEEGHGNTILFNDVVSALTIQRRVSEDLVKYKTLSGTKSLCQDSRSDEILHYISLQKFETGPRGIHCRFTGRWVRKGFETMKQEFQVVHCRYSMDFIVKTVWCVHTHPQGSLS